jgi:nicotinate-nucleotide pyrophosphorylase (carboxylating)
MLTDYDLIKQALQEDLGEGDHTSLATVPGGKEGRAILVAKQTGILAGVHVAEKVFKTVDPRIKISLLKEDGSKLETGETIFEVRGTSISILSAERTALNFIQRMSGIATYTNRLAKKLTGLNTRILDTRKTTPNFRIFEKEAVRIGGGLNHRMGLYDMIMIKDNHVDFAGGIMQAIESTRNYLLKNNLNLKIEIEVRNLDELDEVLESGGIDRIMLDNFSVPALGKAIQRIHGRFETEASGGINEDTIRAYAETGVDYISVGALTHQVKSLDMSLKALKP